MNLDPSHDFCRCEAEADAVTEICYMSQSPVLRPCRIGGVVRKNNAVLPYSMLWFIFTTGGKQSSSHSIRLRQGSFE